MGFCVEAFLTRLDMSGASLGTHHVLFVRALWRGWGVCCAIFDVEETLAVVREVRSGRPCVSSMTRE